MEEWMWQTLIIVGLIGIGFWIMIAVAGTYFKKKQGAGNYNDSRYDPDHDDGYSGERWSSDGMRIK